MMKKQGFTLIEILIVLGIVGVLGIIFANVLIQTLRGDNKVRVINQVKQNGQVVLDRLTNAIRQGSKVVCTDSSYIYNNQTTNTIVIFNQGTYTRFRFYPPTTTSNGFITFDYPAASNTICTDAQFLQPTPTPAPKGPLHGDGPKDATDPTPTPTPIISLTTNYLTDTDPVNGVSIRSVAVAPTPANTIFTLNQTAGFNPLVTIKYAASAGVLSGAAYESTTVGGGIIFQTTVEMLGIQ